MKPKYQPGDKIYYEDSPGPIVCYEVVTSERIYTCKLIVNGDYKCKKFIPEKRLGAGNSKVVKNGDKK